MDELRQIYIKEKGCKIQELLNESGGSTSKQYYSQDISDEFLQNNAVKNHFKTILPCKRLLSTDSLL